MPEINHFSTIGQNLELCQTSIWVCLKMEYTPNYSHLVGIMISKTIGFRGTLFSDKPIFRVDLCSDVTYVDVPAEPWSRRSHVWLIHTVCGPCDL